MAEALRLRREPPAFRQLSAARVERRSPHLVRVTLAGAELAGFEMPLPAGSVRLLLPVGDELVLPVWNGNEFLQADGTRPPLRTLTPLRFDAVGLELDVEVVLHGAGPLSQWAGAVRPGGAVALSGPGRGYAVDESVTSFLVAGDESAIPAISVLLEHLPATAQVDTLVELRRPDARVQMSARPKPTVRWLDHARGTAIGDALVTAIEAAELADDARVWVAGEAATMQRVRTHLFEVRGLPRSQCTVRGYWKRGRRGDDLSD